MTETSDARSFSDRSALPSFRDVERAAARLFDRVHHTSVVTSRTLDGLVNAEVLLKCENLQRTGAFKIRGAFNALSQLSDEQKRTGVLTYSSGNHAQAIALSGAMLNIPTTVIMPDDAPAIKRQATEGYGAQVIEYDKRHVVRESLAAQVAAERNLPIIPPYDHPHIVAGQGTAVLELISDHPDLDVVLTPCGGGGLLSGSALAAKGVNPSCRVVGVEPEAGDDATRSFYSGELQTVDNPDTIADGARTPYLGKITFPLVMANVDDMVTVSDQAIIRAMYFLWTRTKMIVEPTGALAVAAVMDEVVDVRDLKVGIVISGGNVDLAHAMRLFSRLDH